MTCSGPSPTREQSVRSCSRAHEEHGSWVQMIVLYHILSSVCQDDRCATIPGLCGAGDGPRASCMLGLLTKAQNQHGVLTLGICECKVGTGLL